MLLELDLIGTLFTIGMLIALIIGFLIGYNRDFTDRTVKMVGIVLSVFAAHYIKNPISVFFYNKLPFFNFFGPVEGVTSLNILLYEFLAFLVVFIFILICLRIIMIFTKLIDKLVGFVLNLGIPTNLFSALIGFCITYFLVFVVAYVMLTVRSFTGKKVEDEGIVTTIINTPILVDTVGGPLGTLLDIANYSIDYPDPGKLNAKAFETMLDKKIIKPINARNLVENGKIDFPEAKEIVRKYEKK